VQGRGTAGFGSRFAHVAGPNRPVCATRVVNSRRVPAISMTGTCRRFSRDGEDREVDGEAKLLVLLVRHVRRSS
jgi:hypothetical protein